MKKIIFLVLTCLAVFYFAYWRLPSTEKIILNLPEPQEKIILVPLDSRPVCTTLPQDIAYAAGFQLILPPNELLDKYTKPANKDFLKIWLKNEAKNVNASIISADILLHGGLLHGRTHLASSQDQAELLSYLEELTKLQKDVQIFSVVPRLLVTDEVLPDAWYWYHLMRYSECLDTSLIFNDFASAQEFAKYDAEIPNEIKTKYLNIFKASKEFNKELLKLSDRAQIIIGQDDAGAFGLPRMTTEAISLSPNGNKARLTNGADELATLLVTKSYLDKQDRKPKVFVYFADPKTKFMHAPYMSMTNTQAVREALEIIGAEETEDEASADVILFINYGHDNFQPGKETVTALQNYLVHGKCVALVDNSQNFDTDELLLPKLISKDFELNKLTAYAGWNTLGNSLGTALCQAVVFVNRKAELPKELHPSLYANNVRMNVNRFLEDYYYQKLKHPTLSYELYVNAIDSRNIEPEDLPKVEQHLMAYTSFRAHQLLHINIGRTPFYEADGKAYYITDLPTGTELPWNRIFEADIKSYPKFGVK
ncbi:MAG: DUF4127 family protein [Phascolarctobacterium sp.]|nr:DUF4127 family protein [Phascolarctobacterium sp.]